MTDELALNKAISEANHAKALLDDELLIGAFDKLEAEYLKAWRLTGALDTVSRERLWQAINIVGKVKDQLSTILSGGTLAQRQLDDIAAKQS